MNITQKRAVFTTTIFGIYFLFLLLFFLIVTPERFLIGHTYILISAIFFFIALIFFAGMMITTNKKDNIIDERDLFIQQKASSTGLISTLIYVFILSIILYLVYESISVLPVSWVWFIAYSTFSFSYFITSLSHLYYYHKGMSND